MRDYRKKERQRQEERAFQRGAEAMKRKICDELSQCGIEQFTGKAAAAFAQRVSVACAS